MKTLGKLLVMLRETSCTPNKNDTARLAGISAEHLRNIEADKSRPSPGVLSRLLTTYDSPDLEPNAWVLLAKAYLPNEVEERVRVLPLRPKETT